MNSLFTWHAPAVKKLLGWRQGGEEEKWAEKAVDSLVKKLKKKKGGQGTIEDLEFALANPGVMSKCVTIPKSLDGRLQVSHKKGLPHVIYCRVWRWPDLVSHQELRPVPDCLYPYDQKNQHICINPYHYQRVEQAHRPFMQQANTHGGYSSGYPSQQSGVPSGTSFSPPLPMQIPSPIGSSYSTASPNASSYMTATSPSSALSEEDELPKEHPMQMQMGHSIQIAQSQPYYWASVGYYELNTRVGELFKLAPKTVVIDGFTDPSSSEGRICLGLISNVNRNSTIESTRKHIGRGLRLEYTDDYNVYLTNLSEAPLFIQSRSVNMKLNQSPTTVCRIPPGHGICIYYNTLFSQLLTRACREGYTALYDLQKMCFIRISFVKGWGPEYQRHDVTSTPCWVEIQLHQPLAWIDMNLPIGQPPDMGGTSMS